MKHTLIKTLSTASLLMVAGQASAHVSYGAPLFDGQGVSSSVMHLATANLAVKSSQTTTATSNTGYLESHDATYWGNSHDSKLMWFSISQPTDISFTITGNANASYNSQVTGQAKTIDTLQPAYNLFQGVAPYLAHDGAYQPSSVNTGFASWSSWAWQALPTSQGGVANPNGQGNLVYGKSYTADAGAQNGQAGQLIDGTVPGVTQHMGVVGSNNGLIAGDTISLSNNATQATYADGSALTNHTGVLTFITGEAAAVGQTSLASQTIHLTTPGVYTLQIAGANAGDYSQLMTDAIATGMGGAEGYQTNSIGLTIQPNTNLQYFDTVTQLYTNTISANTIANSGYTGPLGTPVNGFFAAGTTGTGVGSAYANSWAQVEQYSKVDRAARGYSIAFNATSAVAAVPVPGAVWLFSAGLASLFGFGRKRKS